MTSNGILLKEIIKRHKLNVANCSAKREGMWIRVRKKQKDNIQERSIILEKTLVSMKIDEDKDFCPFNSRKTKRGTKVIYSDHLTNNNKNLIEVWKVDKSFQENLANWRKEFK